MDMIFPPTSKAVAPPKTDAMNLTRRQAKLIKLIGRGQSPKKEQEKKEDSDEEEYVITAS